MRNILQIIGALLALTAAITIDINTVLTFKSSKKDSLAEAWMFEGIFFGSAAGMVVLVVFLLISMLF